MEDRLAVGEGAKKRPVETGNPRLLVSQAERGQSR